jgi:hypothetical protein
MRIFSFILAILLSVPFLAKLGAVAKYFVQYQEYLIACENIERPEMNCNGTCQFSKELAELDKNTVPPDFPEVVKIELSLVTIIKPFNLVLDFHKLEKSSEWHSIHNQILAGFSAIIVPPPRVA